MGKIGKGPNSCKNHIPRFHLIMNGGTVGYLRPMHYPTKKIFNFLFCLQQLTWHPAMSWLPGNNSELFPPSANPLMPRTCMTASSAQSIVLLRTINTSFAIRITYKPYHYFNCALCATMPPKKQPGALEKAPIRKKVPDAGGEGNNRVI